MGKGGGLNDFSYYLGQFCFYLSNHQFSIYLSRYKYLSIMNPLCTASVFQTDLIFGHFPFTCPPLSIYPLILHYLSIYFNLLSIYLSIYPCFYFLDLKRSKEVKVKGDYPSIYLSIIYLSVYLFIRLHLSIT